MYNCYLYYVDQEFVDKFHGNVVNSQEMLGLIYEIKQRHDRLKIEISNEEVMIVACSW